MDRIAKKKRLCSYNKELKANKILIKPVSSNSTKAFCTLCVGSFHRGTHDMLLQRFTKRRAMLAKGTSNIGALFCGTNDKRK